MINMFDALDPAKIKAEKDKKMKEKKSKVDKMKNKQAQMRPFVIISGVRDNPLPYEHKYREQQIKEKNKIRRLEQKRNSNKQSPRTSPSPEMRLPKIKHARNLTIDVS